MDSFEPIEKQGIKAFPNQGDCSPGKKAGLDDENFMTF